MKLDGYFRSVVWLAGAGTLFAGYLSGIKLFSGQCAFNESCPYFLGYPACYFGLGLFLAMFGLSFYAVAKKKFEISIVEKIMAVSVLGILFAGYFVVGEIIQAINNGFTLYGLGFPTCVYGLVFYAIIFYLSLLKLRLVGKK